jgi:hypothetical protein
MSEHDDFDDAELEYERRKQDRLEKLGTDHPVCTCCGESRWEVFEGHHLAGRKHHGDIALVCLNCHKVLTVAQECRREPGDPDEPFLATVGHYLIGLADMLLMIAKSFAEFGKRLLDMAYGREPQAEGGAP